MLEWAPLLESAPLLETAPFFNLHLTSGIGSIAGNGSFVESAPLRKDERAWDEQERALFLVV